jgi:hypothetical protein
MDFDNNLEFDDNGKPKSGRAVLVDEDAVLDDKIDEMISVPIEQSQVKQMNLNDDMHVVCCIPFTRRRKICFCYEKMNT